VIDKPNVETRKLWIKFDKDIEKRSYLFRVILAIDQLFNVILFNGSQDQTMSGNIAKKQYENTSKWYHDYLCKILNVFESSHCWKSRKE